MRAFLLTSDFLVLAEIVEIFQWLTQEESRNLNFEKKARVKEEIGDVMIFLANLADKLGIDAKIRVEQLIKEAV